MAANSPAGIQLVWFKRDLRVADHRPLAEAAARGPVLPIYLLEDEVLHADDFSEWHWRFIAAGLRDLRAELAARGQPLIVRRGGAVQTFEAIRREHGIAGLWAHEETGNGITYARDRAVRRWAREQGVPFHETPRDGVVRRLASRDGWSRIWEQRMAEALTPAPAQLTPLPFPFDPGVIPDARDLGLDPMPPGDLQPGSRHAGLELLDSFLANRGQRYRSDMSSPVTAESGCSRLSPYLAWGLLSLREVVHAVRARRASLADEEGDDAKLWRQSLHSFDGRLHWHCHFIQKLEDEPRIEFENLARSMDGLREDSLDEARFAAWLEGATGYPFIDACMRYLRETGWINFRMRAMLVSFASYHLWLHWRRPALALARLFVDYEPGIHYSQFQMQSGTTGINTVRIYSPVKQGFDQDPAGEFVRRWVPELRDVPDQFIHEPWLAPQPPRGYPKPIVDHKEAVAFAKAKVYGARRADSARAEAKEVARKHGSRKRSR